MARMSLEESVGELMQAIGLIVRRLRAVGATGLSMTESSVLSRLARNGPATTAELARAESVRPQSMGATVAALEEQGLVERRPHPTDGRQMEIHLTEKGSVMRQSVKNAKVAYLARAIRELSEEERETLFLAGRIIGKVAER